MKTKTTFRHELFSALAIVAIITLLICCLFTTGFFRRQVDKNYQEEATQSLEQITGVLDGLLTDIDEISADIGKDKDILEYINVNDSEQKKYLYQALFDATAEIVDKVDFALYSMGGDLKYTSDESLFGLTQPLNYGPLMWAREHSDELVIAQKTDYESGSADTCLNCTRMISDEYGRAVGYFVVRVDNSGMDDILRSSLGNLDSMYLLDSRWNVFYGSDRQDMKETGLKLKYSLMDTGSIYYSGGEDKYYVSQVGDYGMFAVLEQHEIFTRGIARTMYFISSAIALLCLLVCLGVSFFMSRYLTKPVEELTDAMQKVGEGNLDVRLANDRHDEFGEMAENFNSMAGELKANLEERIATQKELDRAHAATMQAQLNPHFLYNTLDTIKWVAKANNVPEIATMSSGLAKILRTSISGGKYITLKEELEFVRNYMKIQRIRFSDRFDFVDNIPEEYYSQEVPKLIIQPLVENAIVHGFDEGETGRIVLDIVREGSDMIITVTDNGRGIGSDMLEAINTHSGSRLEGHHGVYNVDTIIRLNYGDRYGVTAKSRPADEAGRGMTVVSVRLPMNCIKAE